MPWLLNGNDGLKLVGVSHYDDANIERLVEQLRQSRNQPQTVCKGLEDLIANGVASKKLIWRLSKWCHWNDPSEEIAQRIADQLFHGHICRRLLDQANKPIPDRRSAESDYQAWLRLAVQTDQNSPRQNTGAWLA
jgi:hypothetical protein